MDDPSRGGRADRTTNHGPTAVATVTVALIAWKIAFNLGAYGEVFYEDVFGFVVASTVGLVIATVVSPRDQRARWFTMGALVSPVLWFALAAILFDSTAAAASDPVFGVLALGIVVVAVPTGLKLLLDLFTPDLTSLHHTRALGFATLTIVVVAAAGFAVGANNDAFLTCDDFKVAGSDTPSNCAPG